MTKQERRLVTQAVNAARDLNTVLLFCTACCGHMIGTAWSDDPHVSLWTLLALAVCAFVAVVEWRRFGRIERKIDASLEGDR